MSDTGRQSLFDKASAAVHPDSQKTTTDLAGDRIKGTSDDIASTLQPEAQKSASQSAGDTISGNSNDSDDSLLGKAKNAVGLGDQL